MELQMSEKSEGASNKRTELEIRKAELEVQRAEFELGELKNGEPSKKAKSAYEAFHIPAMLAVVGGIITFLASIGSSLGTAYLERDALIKTAEINRDAAKHKAGLDSDAEYERLQGDLIKQVFEERSQIEAVNRLEFLVKLGLVPKHQKAINEFLEEAKTNAGTTVPIKPAPLTADENEWRSKRPNSASCFQRDFLVKDRGQYLVRCFRTEIECEFVRLRDKGRKSICMTVPDLDKSKEWIKGAKGGGYLDSWYLYSDSELPPPIPSIAN
jgi:hypothetical protein